MAKTRKEIAASLGISTVTLWRILRDTPFTIPSGKISARDELKILRHLGAEPSVPPPDAGA